MNYYSRSIALLLLYGLLTGCNAQQQPPANSAPQKKIGGHCDNCEQMYIDMPDSMSPEHSSPGWTEPGQKLMVTGSVFKPDGKTPAPNVVVYYWHTDSRGIYSSGKGSTRARHQHGRLRGWVKTGANGRYLIKTLRPAPYPKQAIPAHIHLLVKEPGLANEYYTDDIVFDDDPLLIAHVKKYAPENRGGSGVVRVLLTDSAQIAEHNIVLGLNIPQYPKTSTDPISSGLPIGQDQPSFLPYHAYGPDKGTQTCPVCKYGRYHGILYFVGSNPQWPDIKKWLLFLEAESVKRKQWLKAYLVYGNPNGYPRQAVQQQLALLGAELDIHHVALTFVPSFTDQATEAYLNQINPQAQNTFIIYKHRNIVDKYINLAPTPAHFSLLVQALDNTQGEYFHLAEPAQH